MQSQMSLSLVKKQSKLRAILAKLLEVISVILIVIAGLSEKSFSCTGHCGKRCQEELKRRNAIFVIQRKEKLIDDIESRSDLSFKGYETLAEKELWDNIGKRYIVFESDQFPLRKFTFLSNPHMNYDVQEVNEEFKAILETYEEPDEKKRVIAINTVLSLIDTTVSNDNIATSETLEDALLGLLETKDTEILDYLIESRHSPLRDKYYYHKLGRVEFSGSTKLLLDILLERENKRRLMLDQKLVECDSQLDGIKKQLIGKIDGIISLGHYWQSLAKINGQDNIDEKLLDSFKETKIKECEQELERFTAHIVSQERESIYEENSRPSENKQKTSAASSI